MLTGVALDKVVQNSWGGTLSITILVSASGSLIWINFYAMRVKKFYLYYRDTSALFL